jgi:hypothetical protein
MMGERLGSDYGQALVEVLQKCEELAAEIGNHAEAGRCRRALWRMSVTDAEFREEVNFRRTVLACFRAAGAGVETRLRERLAGDRDALVGLY